MPLVTCQIKMQGLWLQACRGSYNNASNPIVAYREAGGDVNRCLTAAEVFVFGLVVLVRALCRPHELGYRI